jgi:hypothetical protein
MHWLASQESALSAQLLQPATEHFWHAELARPNPYLQIVQVPDISQIRQLAAVHDGMTQVLEVLLRTAGAKQR